MTKRKHAYNTHRRNRKKRRIQRNNQRDDEDNEFLFPSVPPTISPVIIFLIFVLKFLLEHLSIFSGCSNRQIRRKDLEKDIFEPYGDYFICRAYRMSRDSFYVLHDILKPYLFEHFFPKGGGKRDPKTDKYLIKTEMRLAIALRYFAGGSPLDIMLIHGVSFSSVFHQFGVLLIVSTNVKSLSYNFLQKKNKLKFLMVISRKVELCLTV